MIACASSPDKIAFAKAHGADEGIDYTQEDLKAALKRLGGETGIDVVFDPVGGGEQSEQAGARARLVRAAAGDRLCRRRDPQAAPSTCCS